MGYIATQMQAPPGAQIVGAALADWTNNLESHFTAPVFEKYGLSADDIRADEWYDGAILDAMWREMYAMPGAMQMMVAIGKAAAPQYIGALRATDIKGFLEHIDEFFSMFIRNAPDEYGFHVTWVDDNRAHVWNNTNAPNDHLFGLLWEMARQLRTGSHFVVRPIADYDTGSTKGATFEVEWE
jgi:hypothetical protein